MSLCRARPGHCDCIDSCPSTQGCRHIGQAVAGGESMPGSSVSCHALAQQGRLNGHSHNIPEDAGTCTCTHVCVAFHVHARTCTHMHASCSTHLNVTQASHCTPMHTKRWPTQSACPALRGTGGCLHTFAGAPAPCIPLGLAQTVCIPYLY